MPILFQQPQAEAAAAEAQEAQDEHDMSMTEQAEADYYARVANEELEEDAADAEGEELEEDAAEAATEGHDEEAAEADPEGFEGEAEEAPEVLPFVAAAMTQLAQALGEPVIGEFADHAEEGNGVLASDMFDLDDQSMLDGLTCWINTDFAADNAEPDDNEYPEGMQGDEGGEGCEGGEDCEGCEGCKGGEGLETIPEGDEAELEDAETEVPSDEAFPEVLMAVNKRCEQSIEKDGAPEEIEEEEGEAPTDMATHPWDGKPLPTDASMAEEAPEEEAAEATAEEAPEEEAPQAQGEICSS